MRYDLSTIVMSFNGTPVKTTNGADAADATLGHCLILALTNADPRKRHDKKLKMYELVQRLYRGNPGDVTGASAEVELAISEIELCKALVIEHFPTAIAGPVHELLTKGTHAPKTERINFDKLGVIGEIPDVAPMKDADNLGLVRRA